jgi:hypothetical protein
MLHVGLDLSRARLDAQDVARFDIGLRHVQDDAGPPLGGPGGNRQAHQRTGRHVVASVRAGDVSPIRREHPWRRERLPASIVCCCVPPAGRA